jgi:hypothetical protein
MFVATDLSARIRLGMHHLAVNFDESRDDLPWFDVRLFRDGPGSLEHFECFDTAHVPGRCLDALLYGEAVTGAVAPEPAVQTFRRYHFGSFDADDGLNGYVDSNTGRRAILFHNLREGMLGLNALVVWRGDEEAKEIGDRMVDAIWGLTLPDGSWHQDNLDALRKAADLQIGPPSAVTGRLVGPLLTFARVAGNLRARELAYRLGTHVAEVTFDQEGNLTEQAGQHVHSITSTISSFCQLAVESSDSAMLDRAEQIYHNAPAPWRSRFGWVKELIGPPNLVGEVNSTGDLIQAALLLAGAGRTPLYGEAEVMLRGHLLLSQIAGMSTIHQDWSGGGHEPWAQEDIASRSLGGFGFPAPNDRASRHYDEQFVRITTLDITAGSVQAMCRGFQCAIDLFGHEARINLLLDTVRPDLVFRMIDLKAGLFELRAGGCKLVHVRIPQGSVLENARFAAFGHAFSSLSEGVPGYLRIAGLDPISGYLSIPPTSHHESEVLAGSPFELDYIGEQLVAISPPGQISPIASQASF